MLVLHGADREDAVEVSIFKNKLNTVLLFIQFVCLGIRVQAFLLKY